MTKRRPPTGRTNIGQIPAIRLPVTFDAGPGFVTAVFHIDNSTIGIKFESPDQMFSFCTQLMETATIVWPDNPFIREYASDVD